MAERFDILGFIRDMGDRARAKKLIAENQDVLASGNPDSIAGLAARDPQNPHFIGALKNVFDNLNNASGLKGQSSGRQVNQSIIGHNEALTGNVGAQTADTQQNTAQRGTQFNQLQAGRQAAMASMPQGTPGGGTPEGVKYYNDMLQQFLGVKQGEVNVDNTVANTGHTNAMTGLTQEQTNTAAQNREQGRINFSRMIQGEDAAAQQVGVPNAGPLALHLGQLQLGQGELGVRQQTANEAGRHNQAEEGNQKRAIDLQGLHNAISAMVEPLPPGMSAPRQNTRARAIDQMAPGIDAATSFGQAADKHPMLSPQDALRQVDAAKRAGRDKIVPAQKQDVSTQQTERPRSIQPNYQQSASSQAYNDELKKQFLYNMTHNQPDSRVPQRDTRMLELNQAVQGRDDLRAMAVEALKNGQVSLDQLLAMIQQLRK